MTIFYSDVEPLSKYSPVTLHLSPATRILNENPVYTSLIENNHAVTGALFCRFCVLVEV